VNTGRAQLTVVIPTYRRPDLLRRCLESLAAQDARGSFDIVVVDDASGDETTRMLEQRSASMPELTWTSLPANRGQAAARNKGVELAGAPTVLFVDDDIVASPSLVATHLRLLSAADAENDDGTLGVVGLVEWHPDLPATPFRRWLDSTQLQFGYHTWMAPGPIDPPETAFYTCNLSMSAQLFRDAGGFDERLRSLEDIELGHRLGRLGFRLDYRPEALAWHARDIDLAAFCRRQVVVGAAAVQLRAIDTDLTVDIDGMLAAQRSPLVHAMLSASRALPRIAGRDPRSAYYWSRAAKAYADGVRAGSASSS
jgi:GT2 family glycosyltransferase